MTQLFKTLFVGQPWQRKVCQLDLDCLHKMFTLEAKNPAYGRHRISRYVLIVGTIQLFKFLSCVMSHV